MFTRLMFAIAMVSTFLIPNVETLASQNDACPVTSPNGITPPGEVPGPNRYYQNGIYVAMDGDGYIYAKTEDGGSTGWIKAIGFHTVGSESFEVESRYLGGEDLQVDARIAPAFGRETPLHVGSVTFPAEGCWELTYSTDNAAMTFVVEVRFVEKWSATPAA